MGKVSSQFPFISKVAGERLTQTCFTIMSFPSYNRGNPWYVGEFLEEASPNLGADPWGRASDNSEKTPKPSLPLPADVSRLTVFAQPL